MQYSNILPAIFLARPNRFVAQVKLDGQTHDCHVKNTGRCKELLRPGAEVFLQFVESKNRRTCYDLISVYKGNRLVNIDSQAPNKVVCEWLKKNGLFGEPLLELKPEFRFGKSRIDFYVKTAVSKYLIEVKGVTLENNGIARFPDAPTQRGVRHLYELSNAAARGFCSIVIFVIQMGGVQTFEPNWQTHSEFGAALRSAQDKGVTILAMDCVVTKNSLVLRREIPVSLDRSKSNHY